MVAEPMLRARRPEIVPESITVAPAPTAATAVKAQLRPDTNTHVNAASSIRISLLLELPGRGGAGARGGKVEHDIVGGDVRFSFVELHLLAIGGALGAGFLGKRKVDPIHFLVIAVVDDRLVGHAVLDAPVDRADLEEVIRIEIDVGNVAVRPRHAQLVRLGAVDVLGTKIVECVAPGFVVHQGAGEVRRILAHPLGVVGGQFFRILAALERIDLPRLCTVIRLHQGQALQRGLVAHRLWALQQGDVPELDRAAVDQYLAGEAQRVDRVQLVDATAGFDVLGGELLGGIAERDGCCEQRQHGCDGMHGVLQRSLHSAQPLQRIFHCELRATAISCSSPMIRAILSRWYGVHNAGRSWDRTAGPCRVNKGGGMRARLALPMVLIVSAVLEPVARTAPVERARDIGVPFEGAPGPLNAITDVPGVEVGQVSLISGQGPLKVGVGPVRTGVTIILPRGRANSQPVYGGFFDLNGNGEMTGQSYLHDFGVIQGPIGITNTNAIGQVYAGIQSWTQQRFGEAADPVVAETWDGELNDIRGFHVRPETAIAAIEAAKSGAIAEGSVGGGTGMECFGFKGGIGTASRKVALGAHSYMVGALVQCNTGDRKVLRIGGVLVGPALSARWLPCYDPRLSPPDKQPKCAGSAGAGTPPADGGSIIIVVGTDAPLVLTQLDRLAKRAAMGPARPRYLLDRRVARQPPRSDRAVPDCTSGQPGHRPAVRRGGRGDRGGDCQRDDCRTHHDGCRWLSRVRAAP